MPSLRTLARTVQTNFPALLELKFATQRLARRALRRPFEADFNLLDAVTYRPDLHWIDAGANRGQTIDAMRLFSATARIVSFEPNPTLANRLVKRFASDELVRIEPCGLGDSDGDFELHVPVYGRWEFDGLASFDLASAREWLATRIVGFNQDKLSVRTHSCHVKRLDDLNLRPQFIKIDVQGFERQVLLGGARTLREFTPILLIETGAEWEPPSILGELGYVPCALRNKELNVGGRYGFNTFFLTKESIDSLEQTKIKVVT